jgi:hypothetical protein
MPDFNYNWDHASINALFWRDARLVSLELSVFLKIRQFQRAGTKKK